MLVTEGFRAMAYTRQYRAAPSSKPPPLTSLYVPAKSTELMRLLRAEEIMPIGVSETLPQGAVLRRLPDDDVVDATVRWVVFYDRYLPEHMLADALCACVLEFLAVADADEGGPLRG